MPFREFEGCRERIARAQAHAKTFWKTWSEFVNDEPYSPLLKVDDAGRGTLWVKPRYKRLPSVFPLLLGELLYQLRAALDGAIYAAAIRETRKDPPPDHNRLEFPICASPADFEKAARKIAPLSKKRRAIVESVQPYNVVKTLRPAIAVMSPHRTLAILHDWARRDRHRTLHVMGSWASQSDPVLTVPAPAYVAFLLVNSDGLLEVESQVCEFGIGDFVPGMEVEANPNLMIEIVVHDMVHEPVSSSDNLDYRIRMMIATVDMIVHGLEKSFERRPRKATRLAK